MGDFGNRTTKNGLTLGQIGMMALYGLMFLCACGELVINMLSKMDQIGRENGMRKFALWELGTLCVLTVLLIACIVLRRRFDVSYKTKIVKQAAAGLPGTFHYYGLKGLERGYIEKTGFVTLGKVFSSEDLVEGSYRGISFRRADVCSTDRKKQPTKIFIKGAWFIFSYNKPFKSELRIESEGFNEERRNLLSGSTNYGADVITENWTFNELFRCTAKDSNEASTLLSPQMTQLMVDLQKQLACPMMAATYNNQLVLILKTGRDHMETSIIKPMDSEEEIKKTREELDIACRLIDAFRVEEGSTM